MDKIKRVKELNEQLQKASYAYYGQDNPIMSDKEYDDLYNELSNLEKETGCILAGSPTQKVQGYVLEGFKKVEHSKPMLSADKTKDINEIKKFINNEDFYCSYKLDGLTLVVKYIDGKFTQGITRGNGLVGEDVTEQCRFIKNLPMQISNKNPIELRGECVISWEEFRRTNRKLDTPFSNPRNLAAGTLRNLDLNVVKERDLSFVVFEMVHPSFTYKWDGLKVLEELGFECVGRAEGRIEDCIEGMQPEFYKYPTDGLIFEINSSELSKSLGSTAHHECCRMALKWEDELYDTILRNIEWNTSKTGLINPVAVFEPVDLDGAIITRATLHNVSYIENLQLGIGDTIQVYRANMVIPKVHSNLTMSNTWKLPDKCPCCGGNVKIHNENGSKTLYCTNSNCKAKLLGKLVQFVSKNAINIDGLSEQTLQKFIDLGWLYSFRDIYYLSEHKEDMYKLDSFGKKSVDKLLESIEKSRNTTLDRFIYGLCIPLIGRTASKQLSLYCRKVAIKNMWDDIYTLYNYGPFYHSELDGFGEIMCNSLNEFISENKNMIIDLSQEFSIEKPNNTKISSEKKKLKNKIFVITGNLNHYKNRDELVSIIEEFGGEVGWSVSTKTNYLINNDAQSNSSKNKNAHILGVPIINENEFIQMITS
mgnify:CR=1 FL=1